MCPDGTFQPEDHLKTDRTVSSNCRSHSPCNPKYGKKECRAGTTSTDIGCMCDPDRGFSQSHPDRPECDCFTTNDFCNCQETGCANGTTKNAEGLCVPVTKEPKSQKTPTPVFYYWTRRHKQKRKNSSKPINSSEARDRDCAASFNSNGNSHPHPASYYIEKADHVFFQNGTMTTLVKSKSKTPGGRASVAQQRLTDAYVHVGTESNSEDHTSDEDDNLTPENQNSTRFPQPAFVNVQPKSTFIPTTPISELDQKFEIVPSGAAASRDEAASHPGDDTNVSTSAASCFSATPIQQPSIPEQAHDAGPSAPPDETPHPEPSAPLPSMPYEIDTGADEGDQSESEEDEKHCPLNIQQLSRHEQATAADPSASPDKTSHPEPLAPPSPMLCAINTEADEGDQSESEDDEERRLLNGSETAIKSFQQLQDKETLHKVVLPNAEKQLLLKNNDNWEPAAGGLMFA